VARKTHGQDRIHVAGEKEHERQELVREGGIPVNRNLRRDLQIVRDELGIVGYEAFL
jgi:LDH2 family malate/lactate/ureidoglycolate dehydrogenase